MTTDDAIAPVESSLTAGEWEDLSRCEEVIERGLQTFEAVGNALLTIRDGRLYRATHTAFASYCIERWRLGARRAYQLIEAAEVAANVNHGSQLPITNERQARALAPLLPEEQREVYAAAVEAHGAGITAKELRLWAERKITVRKGRSGEQHAPPLPARGKFSLILADPPWQYDFSNFSGKVAENHYPTMSLEAICSLPVGAVAAKDCVLILWATSCKLPEQIRVAEAWGFIYKTIAVWDKTGEEQAGMGLGHYFRQDHELLILATRGAPGTGVARDISSIIRARKGRHSEKPPVVYELLERMYPDARRLELFARTARAGWTAWGNEAPDTQGG